MTVDNPQTESRDPLILDKFVSRNTEPPLVAGCFLAYLAFDAASTNDDGWPLYRTAQFFQSLVVYVYWGTFIACLCAIGIGAIPLVRSVLPPRHIVLRTDEIESPRSSFYHGITVVKYRDILELSIRNHQTLSATGKRARAISILKIKHKNGTLNIPEGVLKDSNTINIIHDKLLSCTSPKQALHEKADWLNNTMRRFMRVYAMLNRDGSEIPTPRRVLYLVLWTVVGLVLLVGVVVLIIVGSYIRS